MIYNRLLEAGRGWEPCKTCGLPCIISESWSVYGGTISHGCANCLVRERDALRAELRQRGLACSEHGGPSYVGKDVCVFCALTSLPSSNTPEGT